MANILFLFLLPLFDAQAMILSQDSNTNFWRGKNNQVVNSVFVLSNSQNRSVSYNDLYDLLEDTSTQHLPELIRRLNNEFRLGLKIGRHKKSMGSGFPKSIVPFIAILEYDGSTDIWVVLRKMPNQDLVIMDGATGCVSVITGEVFLRHWTGTVIYVGKTQMRTYGLVVLILLLYFTGRLLLLNKLSKLYSRGFN